MNENERVQKGEAPSTGDEASRKETDMTETERQETMSSPSSITPEHQKTIEPIDAVREEIVAAGKRALDTEWQIREQLRFCGYKEGDRVVIEALPPRVGENRGTFYAWSDDVATLVDLARNVKVPHQGVYIHADPIFPDATAKFGPNEWVKQGGGAGFVTKDVASIRVLKIDVDPIRKNNMKDVSTTKEETDEAKSVARSIYNDLAPVVGTNAIAYLFSGNGVQLHIALDDLANDESNIEKTKRILQSLNVLYSSEGKAEIDTTLVDPRRVVPLAGTMKRKGHNDIGLNLHFGQSPDRLILWACTDP